MKDLKSIAIKMGGRGSAKNALQRFAQEEVVIDEFAKSIINKVFDQLSKIFPAWQYNWKTQKEIDGAKMEWTKAFNENDIRTMEQIKHGFAKARKSETDFLPSCGKFISWCSPSPEDLGYPSEQQALRKCIEYRNKMKMGIIINARPFIVELVKCIDWWLMNAASNQVEHKEADKHFKDEYLKLINSDYQEPVETPHERLETTEVVSERMSPEQIKDRGNRAKNCADEVRKQLALKKLNNK